MKFKRIKKVIITFLILNLIFISNAAVVWGAKKTTADKLMENSLGNSIINEEYPESKSIAPVETDAEKDAKALIIHCGVEKLIDITLAECIKIALGNNPRIKMAMDDVLASHTRIGQAWSNYFPRISWTTQASRVRALELEDALDETLVYRYYLLGSISLSQLLYDFGFTQNQVTIKKLSYEGYKESLTETINDVICNTKKAYYNLLLAYDTQKTAQETVEKYEKFYNQAKAFYEIGLNPKVDVTIAAVNLSKAKSDLIYANNQISLALTLLNKSMGIPFYHKYNVRERLKYSPIKMTLDEAIDVAKASRPDLKKAELKVEEAKQTVKLAQKSYCPKLEARGSYMRGGGDWNANYGYNYGVFLNFNAVNVLLNQKQIQEAKSLYNKEISAAQKTRGDIYLEIQTAYLNLDEKRNQIPVRFLQVKQAKENYELSFGRYKVGVGNPVELKDAQSYYNEALVTYYKTLYDYNSAKADLEKAIGRNIPDIEDDIE